MFIQKIVQHTKNSHSSNSITINGSSMTFNGSSVTINGRTILGKHHVSTATQQFSKLKKITGKGIEAIAIVSEIADVEVVATDSKFIEANLDGKKNEKCNYCFEFNKSRNQLEILVDVKDGCFIGEAKLKVSVPKQLFDEISIETTSNDIKVNRDVSANILKAKSVSGDIETSAIFNKSKISTTSGNVEIIVEVPKEDMVLIVDTISGDVRAKLDKIKYLGLYTNTISGKVKNKHKEGEMYEADVTISTISGDIKIS